MFVTQDAALHWVLSRALRYIKFCVTETRSILVHRLKLNRRKRFQMETAAQEILTDKTINPVFQRAYNVRGWVNTRAYEIKHEMALVSVLYSTLWIIQTHNPSFSAFFVRYIWKQNMLHLCSCLTACLISHLLSFVFVWNFRLSKWFLWFPRDKVICMFLSLLWKPNEVSSELAEIIADGKFWNILKILTIN